jgi:hypothetical protein
LYATSPGSQAGQLALSRTAVSPGTPEAMISLMRSCLSRRDFGSFGLPMSRNRKTPMYGMKKIASSHAIAAVGFRLRGTTIKAVTRTTRSTRMPTTIQNTVQSMPRASPSAGADPSAAYRRGVRTIRVIAPGP